MFDAQSPQQTATFTSTKSSSSTTKLTTRVTLASRQFKRRLSDIGIVTLPARMSDVRHSVCGNELYDLHQQKLSQNTDTMAAGQSFERLSHRKNECRAVAASTTMLCNADRISDLLSTPRSRVSCKQNNFEHSFPLIRQFHYRIFYPLKTFGLTMTIIVRPITQPT